MQKPKKSPSKSVSRSLFAFCGIIILLAGYLIVNSIKPQPAEIDLSLRPALEIKDALTLMYFTENTLLCVPGISIDTLASILVDSGDYQPTDQEIKNILQVYGPDGLAHAGLLTAKQAYYRVRLNPPKTTPPPGMIPTRPPAIYCPGPDSQGALSFQSIALESAEKAIVEYSLMNGDYEAILRNIGGRWLVSSIKLVHWYGNG